MPSEPSLPGTSLLQPGWRASFRDRYPEQHAQSLAWLERELARLALVRDAERRQDAGWLGDKRAQLARLSGAGRLPSAVEGVARFPLATSDPAYLIQVGDRLRFGGLLLESEHDPPLGLAILAGPDLADRALAYRAQGFRVALPVLAQAAHSFAEHPVRRWYRFSDDELLHLFFFIVGGSLAGMEAVELQVAARALGTEGGRGLPVVLDIGGRHALTAAIAAALDPDLVSVLVLRADELTALDHQERAERVNTLWRWHRHFDALTMLALAAPTKLLVVEKTATPSAAYSRALAWFGRERIHHLMRLDARSLAATVTEHLPSAAQHASVAASPLPASPDVLTSDDLYRQTLESKLAWLEAEHARARQCRRERYDLAALTPDAYRERAAASIALVTGPPLPETVDRQVRTRLIDERPTHRVYEVVLTAVEGVDVSGYLLIPTAGLPAPAVICQHGLGGRPDWAAGIEESAIYDRLGTRLAEKGYVTFAPCANWGWGGTPGRDALVKRAYALGVTPNRFEVAQLHAVVDLLQSRPEVIADRIAYYGLSYGGHASVWLCANEPRLCAVVTAGHFNDWQDKLTSTEITPPLVRPTSYITVDEGYDMFTYNVLNALGHAEFVTRFAPRPHMVENGLRDTVTPTAWVNREFAREQAVFAWLGASEDVEIEHFPGPHRVWSEGSFRFLHRHLRGAT